MSFPKVYHYIQLFSKTNERVIHFQKNVSFRELNRWPHQAPLHTDNVFYRFHLDEAPLQVQWYQFIFVKSFHLKMTLESWEPSYLK